MRARRGYAPDDVIFPCMGLDNLSPSTLLDPHYSPALDNVKVDNGNLSKRHGYVALGAQIQVDGVDITDPIMAIAEFEDSGGNKHLVISTTKKQYAYNTTDAVWTNITTQAESADVDWTGDETDTMDWIVARGDEGKYLILTNGKDKPRVWDGTTGTMVDWTMDYPNFVTCKTLASFYDHVVLGNVTTTGTDEQLVVWSNVSKVNDFTGGSSGEAVIGDSRGSIERLLALGDRLVIYSENSIGTMTYVGGDLIFSFEQLIQDSRLVSGRAVVNLGPFHMFMSQENFYLFDGSKMIRPGGDRVHKKFSQELSYTNKSRAFAFLDMARTHVYWGVPTSSSQTLVYVLEYDVYNLSNFKWVQHTYTDRPVCMGFYSRAGNLAWNSGSMSGVHWDGMDLTWDRGSVRQGFPVRLIGSAGKVFLADDSYGTDNGYPFTGYWESPDFVIPQLYRSELARWIELELELKGYEAEVSYSVDQGATYVSAGRLDLDSSWTHYKVPIDVTSKTIRVRLENACADSNFALRWLRAWFRPAGAW